MTLLGSAVTIAAALIGLGTNIVQANENEKSSTDTNCSAVLAEAAKNQRQRGEKIQYYDSDSSDGIDDVCQVNKFLDEMGSITTGSANS